MKKAWLIFLCILLFSASLSEAGFFDNIMKNIGVSSQPAVGDKEVISGLKEALDLDHYVTKKSLDGLFYMIAREEEKIRTNPAARVTELLKKVFQK